MAAQQSQLISWEVQPSYNNEQQYPAPLNYYETPYVASALSLLIPAEVQYDPLPFAGTISDGSSTGWYMSGTELSPSSEASTLSPNTSFPDSDYPPSRPNQNGRIDEAAKKRRQQNRNSQIAHRQRSKKLVEDLRHEIEEYSEYSQEMYQTLQSLRETTKALVSTIEDALSRQPPMGRRFLERQRADVGGAGRS